MRFPVELTPPDGFDPAQLETWPRVDGRLEWVVGRLLYMPPCGVRSLPTHVALPGLTPDVDDLFRQLSDAS